MNMYLAKPEKKGRNGSLEYNIQFMQSQDYSKLSFMQLLSFVKGERRQGAKKHAWKTQGE